MHSHLGNPRIEFNQILPYKMFCAAWYTFLDLLEIDYSDGFHCSLCVDIPKVVIMDATSLSFKKDMITWPPPLNQQELSILLQHSKYNYKFSEYQFVFFLI